MSVNDPNNTPWRNGVVLGWGKVRVAVQGLPYLITVLLAFALAYVVWVNQQEMTRTQRLLEQVSALRSVQAVTVSREHQEFRVVLERTVEEMAWILTLPDGRRAEVHRQMKTPERFR